MCHIPTLSRPQRQRLAEAKLAAKRKLARAAATQRRLDREAQSAALREQALALRREGLTHRGIADRLGVSLKLVAKAERLAGGPWAEQLPPRVGNWLLNQGFADLPEREAATRVAALTRAELLAAPNFGVTALAAMSAWLAKHDLKLRNEKGAKQGSALVDSCDPLARADNKGKSPCPISRPTG